MSILLDTHVWLWWNTEPERLSDSVREQIADPAIRVCLSAASVWEMAIKTGLGKLEIPEPCAIYVARRLVSDSIWPRIRVVIVASAVRGFLVPQV